MLPTFGFDVLFFFMAGYSLSAWMSLSPEERDGIRGARCDETKSLARAQRPANRPRVARELHEKHDEEHERASAVADKDPVEVTGSAKIEKIVTAKSRLSSFGAVAVSQA